MTDAATDPLVRIALECKRSVDGYQERLELAERDLEVAVTALELAKQDVAEARAELQAIMAVMTTGQQADLVLAELLHHQSQVQKTQKAAMTASPFNVGVLFNTPKTSLRSEKPDLGLKTLADDALLNELQVVWRPFSSGDQGA